jgi:hypothetical protein
VRHCAPEKQSQRSMRSSVMRPKGPLLEKVGKPRSGTLYITPSVQEAEIVICTKKKGEQTTEARAEACISFRNLCNTSDLWPPHISLLVF